MPKYSILCLGSYHNNTMAVYKAFYEAHAAIAKYYPGWVISKDPFSGTFEVRKMTPGGDVYQSDTIKIVEANDGM